MGLVQMVYSVIIIIVLIVSLILIALQHQDINTVHLTKNVDNVKLMIIVLVTMSVSTASVSLQNVTLQIAQHPNFVKITNVTSVFMTVSVRVMPIVILGTVFQILQQHVLHLIANLQTFVTMMNVSNVILMLNANLTILMHHARTVYVSILEVVLPIIIISLLKFCLKIPLLINYTWATFSLEMLKLELKFQFGISVPKFQFTQQQI